MAKLTLSIITQENHLLTKQVDAVIVPTTTGEVTILPGHIPLFTKVSEGVLEIVANNRREDFAVFGGFMDVGPGNEVTILANSAVAASDVNEAKALEAIEQAKVDMEQKEDEMHFRQAELQLRQAMLELKAARRNKQHTAKGSV